MQAAACGHEERAAEDGEPVEMLEIFVRPREDELPPNFQHREFPETENRTAWRLLVGPEQSNAPFTLRNAVWIYDAHLDRASSRILANCKALSSSVALIDAEANEWERYLEARGHAGEND